MSNRKSNPNVLYILTDQWRAKATGYNGDPNAVTPNLDRLAGESINFANAVGTSPVCTPARACLLTGRYPTSTGIFMNDVSLSPEEQSIGKAFKGGGYDTAYIGKWHVDGHGRQSYIPPERRQGFDYWKVLECTHNYQNSKYYDNNDPEPKLWEGYDAFAQSADAAEYIRSHTNSDRPFFLLLSLGPPHFPHNNAPEEYQARIDPSTVVFPPNVTFEDEESEQFTRKEAAGYYAHIAALDKCIGDLIATLKELNLEDETVLVFASDHGEMMGSHGRRPYTKQTFWDESSHVPWLLRFPPFTVNCANRRIATPMNTVDIMPTLLGLCGLEIPDPVEGVDLSSCIREHTEMDQHAALYMSVSPFGGINKQDSAYRALRTQRFTWVRTIAGDEYLFDDVADPCQLNNLADDPESAEIKTRLESDLAQRLERIDDPFREKEYYLEKWGYEVNEQGVVPYRP